MTNDGEKLLMMFPMKIYGVIPKLRKGKKKKKEKRKKKKEKEKERKQ